MKRTIFMDMDDFEKVLAVEERLKSRPKKRMKANDPQPLRAFDGACLCGCKFTLAELKGPCPKRQKGLLKNLQVEAKEHGLNPDSRATKSQLWNMVRDQYARSHKVSKLCQ